MNHYKIQGPAVISFSGGRTSGYMLRKILDANNGLPSGVHVIFADTGRELPETYRFVEEVSERWKVPIRWVSKPGGFTRLIEEKQYLPNPVMRFCTSELKIEPMRRAMRECGYTQWINVVGLRADEPRRLKRPGGGKEWWNYAPLVAEGVTKADVMAFWKKQPFDLQLQPHESNCDLCFLKGSAIRLRIIHDRPETAQWWIDMEAKIGARFRKDAPPYADLAANARDQLTLFHDGELTHDEAEAMTCGVCTD